MKTLHSYIDLLLYSSLFAACCAVGMCMATEKLILAYLPPFITALHCFIFGSTLLIYNTHAIFRKSSPDISSQYAWTLKHKPLQYLFLFIGMALCIIYLVQLSKDIFTACLVLGALSFMYSLPLLPFKNKKRLKDFGWLKILVLTSAWTIVTSVLPMIYWQKSLSLYPFEILIRFTFLFTLCISFDIRDMQTDLEANIFTLPNLIGLNNSYKLMNIGLLLFVVLSTIQYARYPSVGRLSAELATATATFFAIKYTNKHPSDRAYLGLIDGMMLLYSLLIIFL